MRSKFFEANQNHPESAINELQKYFLCEWISGLCHYEFDEKGIDPHDTVDAFRAMLSDEISGSDKQAFVEKGLWNSIEKVRNIFRDPSPQEKLDLIKYNDKSGSDISREAVIYHLKDLVEEKITVITERQLKHL
ncbi:hypothetical protein [Legionella spiritensis]|uniref:Uncharacterized protein n=1 Tax=Legionella spiritensis TaxID=452 RepID=A0A0W0Z525_LEGSP|nr:hypothetical protein [Legionella spiritensis]KTD64263.1 hypothetical protein Lspi_1070 [Legionella spiritensis]SNV47052.1 Uncharacterised protein [Legionella spiritensis]